MTEGKRGKTSGEEKEKGALIGGMKRDEFIGVHTISCKQLKPHSKRLGYPLVGAQWQTGPFLALFWGVSRWAAMNPSGSGVSPLELQ